MSFMIDQINCDGTMPELTMSVICTCPYSVYFCIDVSLCCFSLDIVCPNIYSPRALYCYGYRSVLEKGASRYMAIDGRG